MCVCLGWRGGGAEEHEGGNVLSGQGDRRWTKTKPVWFCLP